MPPLNAQRLAPEAPRPDSSVPPLADEYLRHRAWLTAVLTRRYGRDEAADIAQDTYLRAHAYAPSEPIRKPRSLLMRIALNLASNRRRNSARALATDPHDPALDRRGVEADQDTAAFFAEMLLALPPKLRDVFALTHIEGKTYEEIAQMRGISVAAVKKRMAKAIVKCSAFIGS